ncbi:hypothetical protein [Natrialba hulunbeirensis]|nr:hypothetical protein [Natrialba hulunbeirensis]
MMATTHALAGLALAAAIATVSPAFGTVAAVAAILGGLFPDFDLAAGHRRTLHFPVYYWVLAAPASLVAVFAPSDLTVVLAVFLVAAGLHSVMDLFGCGLEFKPWLGTSDRAVYSHYHGRWLAPRRWIRYDGAPSDLALAAMLAFPALFVFDANATIETAVVVLLLISIGYAALRHPLARLGEWLLARLPASVVAMVPEWIASAGEQRRSDQQRREQ